MAAPVIAQQGPFAVQVEAGKMYLWCACGRSKTQPFCDSSHMGSEFRPVAFEAKESKVLYFCGCKNTGTKPFCDGTHKKL